MKTTTKKSTIKLRSTSSIKFLLIAVVLMVSFAGFSQTNSTMDGLWSDGVNWSNGTPTGADSVQITNNIVLDTDIDIEAFGSFTINGGSKIDPKGGSKHKIKIKDSGKLEVMGNVTIEGELKVEDGGELIVKGCDTLRIGGKLELKDNSKLTVETCAVIFVKGEFKVKDDVYAVVDGNIVVEKKVESSKNAIVAGTGFIETEKKIDVKNNSSMFGSNTGCNPGPCTAGSGSPLPIVLVEFDAQFISSESIQVEWKTRSELNNDYYTIYTSTDGHKFESTERILGAGTSSKELEYKTVIDSPEKQEETVYLKLRQTDFDGRYEEFKPIVVKNRFLAKSSTRVVSKAEKVLLFPNPGDGQSLFIVLNGLNSSTFKIYLFNSSGELILSKPVIQEQGTRSLKVQLLDNMILKKGLYVIQVVSADTKIEKKYIVY